MKSIKAWAKACFPRFYEKLYVWKMERTAEKKRHVTSTSYGPEHADKTFYVIRWQQKGPALAGLVNIVLAGCAYAQEHGYIPVVDFQGTENAYLPPERVGTENVWEWLFEQPGGYTLEDIQHSKNIYLSPLDVLMKSPFDNSYFADLETNAAAQEWKNLYHRYIRLNAKTLALFESKRQQYLLPGKKTIGVKLRGTDYYQKYQGHPIAVPVQECIAFLQAVMEKHAFQQVFLACEDDSLEQKFRGVFGQQLVMSEQTHKQVAADGLIHTQQDAHSDMQDYLLSVWLLAQCDGFYGVACGGTMLAWYMMDKMPPFFKVHYKGLN